MKVLFLSAGLLCSGRDLLFDAAGVLRRSDIQLGQANVRADQALPLGNGRLGVAVWSADGFTAQLNRTDTMPYRYSSGQITIPGLAALTSAQDYGGRLDLFNGTFEEHGGGMTATAFVQRDTDTLVVEVRGAAPQKPQTAQLRLWTPRTPQVSADGAMGILSQTWTDARDPGASGRTFGSLAAITARGQSVAVARTGPLTVTVTVMPDAQGRFLILVAAPRYDGKQDALGTAAQALEDIAPEPHKSWWNAFWHRAGLIGISSPDGSGEYMENLRNLYLFAAAASSGGEFPGSHAGLADLFSSVGDLHRWDPAAFWHWNLRMQVAANLGAGVPELNEPYLRLYRDNLQNLKDWTTRRMEGRIGACVPETMRFNGQGIEYEEGSTPGSHTTALDCDVRSRPFYNARTISTGAEVSLWIWQQYLLTQNLEFLRKYYPVMAESARFLLAYATPGSDGLEHTSPSNAHETQWDTTDPTTDLAARMSLYPATIKAAQLLGEDSELVRQLQSAIPKVPAFPRTQRSAPFSLLPASDQQENEVIADSYVPGAPTHNYENIGLEPVWPYNLIGDGSSLFALAKRTYQYRPYPINQDWSFDPIQAARLGLGGEVSKTLIALTKKYQTFVNGFANWGGARGEFYLEQSAVVAVALQEALLQDYDGLIRIAPAIPPGWDFDGIVAIRGNAKVYVQVKNGNPKGIAIAAGSKAQFRIRNPWPGEPVDVIDASGVKIISASGDPVVTIAVIAGGTYFVQRSREPARHPQFFAARGQTAQGVKRLGPVQIGLPSQQVNRQHTEERQPVHR